MASGTGIMEVLGFFFLVSDSWLFKGPPWLLLFCCSVQQALKGSQVHQALKRPPSLGSFSIGQLLVPECGERGLSDIFTSCV